MSAKKRNATRMDKNLLLQEIVARLHYRGGHKRHMQCVVLSQPLPGGTVLRHDDKEVAQLLDVFVGDHTVEALAVINDDAAQQLKNDTSLRVDENISCRLVESWPA